MSGKSSSRYECINKEFTNENGINYYIYTYKYPSTKGKKTISKQLRGNIWLESLIETTDQRVEQTKTIKL